MLLSTALAGLGLLLWSAVLCGWLWWWHERLHRAWERERMRQANLWRLRAQRVRRGRRG